MITDSRLDPPLPRQCPIRSVISKTWRTTLPPALSGFMGFERMPSSFEKGFDVVLIEKFDDVSIFWKIRPYGHWGVISYELFLEC
jgi:hypothetical protein